MTDWSNVSITNGPSPRMSRNGATLATLERRASYGGRKGRRAAWRIAHPRYIELQASVSRVTSGTYVVAWPNGGQDG